jgi:LysR family transcriptional regulator, cyn operon transcriptional activator
MELNWIRYFYEVAKAGSVTEAARKLRISQPAVTKIVKQAEASLGYPLFRKVGRKLILTPEGDRLFIESQGFFKKWDRMMNLGKILDQSFEGTIRLGASDSIATYVLPQILKAFEKRYPKVSWSIFTGSSTEIKEQLLRAEIDLAFFFTDLNLKDKVRLKEQVIGKVPFIAVTSPKSGIGSTLEGIRRQSPLYVGVRFKDYSHTVPEQWISRRLGISHSRSVEANSKEVQKHIVLSGLGFGVFPAFVVEREVKAKKLTIIRGTKQSLEVRAVRRIDETLTEILNQVQEAVQKTINPLEGS